MEREQATAREDLPHLPQLAKGATEGDHCGLPGCGRPHDDPIHQPATVTEQAAAAGEPLERERGS